MSYSLRRCLMLRRRPSLSPNPKIHWRPSLSPLPHPSQYRQHPSLPLLPGLLLPLLAAMSP